MKKIASLFFAFLIGYQLFGQIKNSGFEVWDSTFASIYQNELINDFNVPNPVSGVINSWNSNSSYGICRTTDAYEGNYALIVHNWYTYIREYVAYSDTISTKPRYLNGYYKYLGDVNNGILSQGIGNIIVTNSTGDTIVNTQHYFDTTSVFVPFEIEIDYLNNDVPDRLFITFRSSNQACSSPANICNLLYLDKLALAQNAMLGISEAGIANLKLYPNPTNGKVRVEGDWQQNEIRVYDAYGKLLLVKNNTHEIDLSRYNPGLYFVHIQDTQRRTNAVERIIMQ